MSEDTAEAIEPRRTRLLRVAEHVRTQNWTAIGIDFLIVVLGVFVGIQVANWNDSLRAADQQEVYLKRLASDFQSIKERTDAHFATFDRIIDGTGYVLQLLRLPDDQYRDTPIDEKRLKIALASLPDSRTPSGSSATYTEMVSQGQLSALRSSALRDRLAEYDRLSKIHLEVHRTLVTETASQHPVLFRHYKVASVLDSAELSGMRAEVIQFDLDAMRADPEFETAVMMMEIGAQNARGVRTFEARLADEILVLIDAESRQ